MMNLKAYPCPMKTAILVGSIILLGSTIAVGTQLTTYKASLSGKNSHPTSNPVSAILHNGWSINAVGNHIGCEDMPTMMKITSDGKWLIAATSGWKSHVLKSYPIKANGELDKAVSSLNLTHTWRGLELTANQQGGQTIYVSGAASGTLKVVNMDSTGKLSEGNSISLPKNNPKPFCGSIIKGNPGKLWVVDESGESSKQSSDFAFEFDIQSETFSKSLKLSSEVSSIAFNQGNSQLIVSDYGANSVLFYQTTTGALIGSTLVGKQPLDLQLNKLGEVFVANSGSDSLSVISLNSRAVVETISTSPYPNSPVGCLPNSIAISKDGSRIFVTQGNNNNLCVVTRRKTDEGLATKVQGFIPTGRFPVSALLSADEKTIWIGIGKGFASKPNSFGKNLKSIDTPGLLPTDKSEPDTNPKITFDYVMSTLEGGITTLAMPDSETLKLYTKKSLDSSPFQPKVVKYSEYAKTSIVPQKHTQKSPIEHVVYIIKENRTYDQVFGDLQKGNGDPRLVLYGREISPNHHKLAEEFVLLDNTYCDGEVSQDGWEWTCAANDSDWNTKATTQSYSGRGNPPGSREVIKPSNQYIWEAAANKKLTYFSYGAKTFKGLFSPTWNGNFSQDWNIGRQTDQRDYEKADIFIRDLKAAEVRGTWSNLTVISLPDDHTSGTKPGVPTPNAFVASNDLALGKIVNAVTSSKFWEKTAIFVIEDDAQNGPDHVDAHRTVALVISPYTKRGILDSTMYTSSSMVRTIGLLLGIPPLSQYDAGANPMYACFTGKKNLTPYSLVIPKVNLKEVNPPKSKNAALSASLDFSEEDLADFGTLNKILWEEAKPGLPYPSPITKFKGH